MLNNLKAELVRKGLKPEKAVCNAIGCCEKTARSKLKGNVDLSIPEAFKITDMYFSDDNFSLDYLFKSGV